METENQQPVTASEQAPVQTDKAKPQGKVFLGVGIVAACAFLGIVLAAWWQTKNIQLSQPAVVSPTRNPVLLEDEELKQLEKGENTTTAISKELEETDLGDLEKEFEEIDAELSNL